MLSATSKKRIRFSIDDLKHIAHAAGRDAADRRMRSQNRKVWNKADYELACKVTNQVWPKE
jgi:hypothetical protein